MFSEQSSMSMEPVNLQGGSSPITCKYIISDHESPT